MRESIAVGLIAIPLLVLVSARPEAEQPWIATDGDTIRHGAERIRLLGVDAPELPTSPRNCQRAVCPPGDPFAARNALQWALNSGDVSCDGTQFDRYGRRLAECFVTAPDGATVSINSWLLARGFASPYQWRRDGR